MPVEYRYTMKDLSGETITVEIHHDDHTGAAIPLPLGTDMPIGIYVPAKDIVEQIWGLGCKINIKTSAGLSQYDHLFATAERERYVKITKGAITIFEGFILPQVYEQQMMPVKDITIPANNQLSNLRDYRSTLLDTDSAFSTIFLFDLIKDILDNGTGLELPIYIKNTLFSKLYADHVDDVYFFDIDTTCYDKLVINKQIYVDEDEVMDGFSILQDILKVTYSRLYYYDGKWIIDRIRDMRLTNDYKIYPFGYPTAPASSISLPYTDFSLENKHKIANSGHLEYSAGMQKHNVIIDFDKYDNLVESSFKNIQDDITEPIETVLGLWQTWNGVEIVNSTYSSGNVTSGLHIARGAIPLNQWPYVSVTTSFLVDIDNSIFPTTGISIQYLYDDLNVNIQIIDYQPVVIPTTFGGGFRLRYKVIDGLDVYWRVIERIGDDLVAGSRYTPAELINAPLIWTEAEITERDYDKRVLQISEKLDMIDIINTVNFDLSNPEQVQFFIDLRMVQKEDVTEQNQRIGDVSIQQNNPTSDNVITGTLNTIFNGVMETRLKIYDGDYVNYKNTLLLEHLNVTYKSRRWSDNYIDHDDKLHYVFIHDTAQQHNTARHSIKVDLWLRDDPGVVVSLGSIFSYDTQLSGKKFMVMGYDFNVKMCTYRIYLRELKEYDSFVLKAGAVPVGEDWPNDMVISYLALNPEQAQWMPSAVRDELLSRLGTGNYLHTTFGPDGQNKTVCDFLYLLQTTGNITTRTSAKTGNALRWDIDGTVTTQNDIPGHALGAGAGIITVSSTDGWTGVTEFRYNLNSMIGRPPKFAMVNLTAFNISNNQHTGACPLYVFTSLLTFSAYNNQFSSFPLFVFPLLNGFWIYDNDATGICPAWHFPKIRHIGWFRLENNQYTSFEALLAKLYTERTTFDEVYADAPGLTMGDQAEPLPVGKTPLQAYTDGDTGTGKWYMHFLMVDPDGDADFRVWEFEPDYAAVLHTVTFTVMYGTTAIQNANISINSQNLTTNASGVATIDLANGSYPYEVTHADYITKSGTVVVDGDDIPEPVYMDAKTVALQSAIFDADDLASVTKDGSNLVSAMDDLAGAFDLAQATAGLQPVHSATPNDLHPANPVYLGDYVISSEFPRSLFRATNPLHGKTGATISFIYDHYNPWGTLTNLVVCRNGTSNTEGVRLQTNNLGQFGVSVTTDVETSSIIVGDLDNLTGHDYTKPILMTVVIDLSLSTGQVKLRVQRVQIATMSINGATLACDDQLCIGTRDGAATGVGLRGNWAELRIVDQALTSAQIAEQEYELYNKWIEELEEPPAATEYTITFTVQEADTTKIENAEIEIL